MIKDQKLPLKDWQNYYIKQDPVYGNLIASILQSIFKNKYISLDVFSETIEKNPSVVLSGEGVVALLLQMRELIDIIPKFYITNYFSELKRDASEIESYSDSDFMLTIRSDFIIGFNKYRFTDLNQEYISAMEKAKEIIFLNNKKILVKYILKQIYYGNYFLSMEFLEREIYKTIISYTGYAAEKIFNKFNISEYSTFEELLTDANADDERKTIENNIKVITVPFTSYHVNNYFNIGHQKIYREDFRLGKKELNIKILFLNADYWIKKENITVYEMLVNHVYNKYLSIKTDKDIKENLLDDSKEIIEDINELLGDNIERNILALKKDILKNEYFDDYVLPVIAKKGKEVKNIKDIIINTLKKEKVPKHEIELINTIDADKLHIKKTFVSVIDKLTNPFLANIVNLSDLKFLKQYIITNYGESLKEEVPEELRIYIEKKFLDYTRSRYSQFVEYFVNVVKVISEFSDEREFLIENILKNSLSFKYFTFKPYLNRPNRLDVTAASSIIKILNREYFSFHEDGADDDLVIIPYMKIKEFLIYLLSEEIVPSWEKLSLLFNDFLSQIDRRSYTAGFGKIEIHMAYITDGVYDIIIKDADGDSRSFSIKKLEDIEYIFQERDLEKYKNIIEQLYMLHKKTAFGFNNKVDFQKYLELYNKRCDDYFHYKKKVEDYEETSSGKNFLINTIKKILYWIPMLMNRYFLGKITKRNFEVKKNANYYYLKDANYFSKNENNEKMVDIRGKISDLVVNKDEKKKYLMDIENAGDITETVSNNFSKKKNIQPKKVAPPPQLQKLESNEEKLFYSLKEYLLDNNDVIFTHDTDEPDENIVIYVKNKDYTGKLLSRIDKEFEKKDINTIEEIGTRYYFIKKLIEKKYIIQKIVSTVKDNEKVFVLFLSTSFEYYNNKRGIGKQNG